jgi:lipoprotein-releasing system ATP-binding protein
MSEAILTINHVAKAYRSGDLTVQVLRDVNLVLEDGASVVISGESGSGKTTLLNLIGGLDRPDSGTIVAAGVDVGTLEERRLTEYRGATVGFVFQMPYLLRDFTAAENVMMPRYMRGESRKAALSRAEELLSAVNLDKRRHHFPRQLSGGERQRVAVARALVNDPGLLLADEPTGNLDHANSRSVEDLLFAVVERYRKSLVLVTHDSTLAARGEAHYLLAEGELRPR